MTTHVVMFRFANSDDAAAAVERLRGMNGRIPGLTAIRAGVDHNGGPNAFDVVLITEHEDRAALKSYASHPVHVEVAEWLADRITDRAVVDTDDL